MYPNSSPCLSALRVVELSQVIAAPFCGQQLARLGAQIVKIESPTGDPLRWRGGSSAEWAQQGLSTAYQAHAFGRQEVRYLDWTSQAGREALRQQVAECDVFLCNVRRHVFHDTPLAANSLCAAFPRLIVCTISGYAADTACAHWPAYDNTIQAASGLMRLNGAQPCGARVGAPILDYATGIAATAAILAALYERTQSGAGQHVQVNMLDVAASLMTAQSFELRTSGREPQYKGDAANSGEPLSRVFATADGFLALAINESHQFEKFARACAQAHWLVDARFATPAARKQHATDLLDAVCTVLLTQSATHWEKVLNAQGVAAARVRTLKEAHDHPGASSQSTLFAMARGALSDAALCTPHPVPSHIHDLRKALK
jgi:crotonobetainyl-CoA:carnitine CoA-transferase CaiB-like acyl-CoA transferase